MSAAINPRVEDFDSLATSPAELAALERLRSATGATSGPMERHCLRCRHIGARIAARRGWVIDGELLTVACILHDIGLYPGVASDRPYTADGAALARELLPSHGWTADRIDRCAEAIDRHHDLRRQLTRGPEVEALRRADLVDVSAGLLQFGIGREWWRTLAREVPHRGLAGELRREIWRALRERPLTLPRIFLRP